MYRHIFIAFDRFPEIKLDELEHEEIIPLLNGKYNFVNGVFKSKAQAALVDKMIISILMQKFMMQKK